MRPHLEKKTDTESARKFIADNGYDPVYGARPLKRFIQSRLETLVARRIIEGNISSDGVITVDADKDHLIVR